MLAPNLSGVKGEISIGTGLHAGSMGDLRASDYSSIGNAISTAALALAPAGGGRIRVLPGDYLQSEAADLSRAKVIVDFSPGAKLRNRHNGAIAFLRIGAVAGSGYDADGSGFTGFPEFIFDRWVAGQVGVRFEDLDSPVMDNPLFRCTTDQGKLQAFPGGERMRFFEMLRCLAPKVFRPNFRPNWGIEVGTVQHGREMEWIGGRIGNRSFSGLLGLGAQPERDNNGVIEYATPDAMAAGLLIQGMEWFTLSDFKIWGVGSLDGVTLIRETLSGTGFSFATADSSLNDAGNGFTNIVAGDVIAVGGFAASSGANNGTYLVTSKSNNGKLIVSKSKAPANVNESIGPTVTVVVLQRADYGIRAQRLFPPTNSEQGHYVMSNVIVEQIAAKNSLELWGMNSAQLRGCVVGPNYGAAWAKNAGVFVSGADGTTAGLESASVSLQGCEIHNASQGDAANMVYVENCQLFSQQGGVINTHSFGAGVRINSGTVRRSNILSVPFATLLPTSSLTHGIVLEAGTIPDGANGGYAIQNCPWNGYATGLVNNGATGTVQLANNNKLGT